LYFPNEKEYVLTQKRLKKVKELTTNEALRNSSFSQRKKTKHFNAKQSQKLV
jgi:hypothetical protein